MNTLLEFPALSIKFYIMKLFLSSIILFISLDWIYYSSKEGNFSVYLPEEPKISNQELESEIGLIKIYSYSAGEKIKKSEDNYIINHTIYPKDFLLTLQDSTMDYIYETILEGLLSQLKDSKLLYSQKEQINGVDSRILLIKYDGDQSLKTALIPFENNLYSLQLFSTMDQRLSNHSDKFFNSFKLNFKTN